MPSLTTPPRVRVVRDAVLTLLGAFLLVLDRMWALRDASTMVVGVFSLVLGTTGLREWYRAWKDQRRP